MTANSIPPTSDFATGSIGHVDLRRGGRDPVSHREFALRWRFFVTTTARDTPTYPWAHANYVRICNIADHFSAQGGLLATHPSEADVIVFVEPRRKFQSDVTCSPIYRAFPDKSAVLDFSDNPFPVVPGLYVGLRRSQHCGEAFQGGQYLRVAFNSLFSKVSDEQVVPDLLYSFVGRVQNASAIRGRIAALRHTRAIVRDQSSGQFDGDIDYLRLIFRSKFVLAPRGRGPSSWRLFETMRAGRVPVVISDDWVEPRGVNWSRFSVRVAERDIGTIPDLLEALEPDAERMGAEARREWERCFSKQNAFAWYAERLSECLSASSPRHVNPVRVFWKVRGLRDRLQFLREQASVRIAGL